MQRDVTDTQQSMNDSLATIYPCLVLVVGAAILFWVTRGAHYHQLAVGILAAAVALLISMVAFEGIWQLAAALARVLAGDRQK
jgi:hypothetical protein